MRKLALATGLLILIGFAPTVQAIPVDVTYSITGTTAVLTGAIPIGSFSGTATIRYRGSGTISAPEVDHGQARIMTWNTSGPVNASGGLLGTAVITGAQTLNTGIQKMGLIGTLKSSGLIFLPLAGTGTASAECNNVGAGTNCTGVIGIPAGIPTSGPLAIDTVMAALASAPITTGAGDVKATFSLFGQLGTFNAIAIEGTATLTELSRTQIPEPSSLSMLWVGLAGLAGARSWQRGRTRRH